MPNDSVILALERQVTCYRRLVKLAASQHECVQQGQAEELLNVLGKRGEVLKELSALEATLGDVKRRWADFASGLSAHERQKSESMVAEVRRLLRQIMAADQDDVIVLQQRKLDLGRQIGKATAARQVNRSYAAAAYGARRTNMDVQQ